MTRDHSLVAELEASGCDRLLHNLGRSHGHIITRSISAVSPADPDIRVETVRPGDRFLLATDGATDVLRDVVLEKLLSDSPTARDAASAVVRTAYRAGSADNITAVVVDA
jgi:protein phosphatase